MGNHPPTKATLSGLVTRIWRYPCRVDGEDKEVLIMLRHYRRKGEKILYVDGKIAHHSLDRIDSGGILPFELLDGRVPCELTIVDYPGLTSYTLTVRGTIWPCDTERVEDGKGGGREGGRGGEEEEMCVEKVSVSAVSLLPVGEGGGGGGAVAVAAAATSGGGGVVRAEEREEEEEEEEDSLIQSSSSAVAREGGKAQTKAFFTVRTTLGRQGGGGEGEREGEEEGGVGNVVVKEHRRRFKEFDKLDDKIRSYFWGHHLASSLPALPLKFFKVMSTHYSPSFLEERRAALDAYMQRLLNFPHVQRNPDWQAFVRGEEGLR